MKGRLIDFAFGYNRKPRVTIELDSDFRNGYDKLKDFDVEISIKKWRQHRSENSNRYFHMLVNEIAAVTGQSDDEVKRRLVVQYGTIARDEDGKIMGMKLPPAVDVDQIYPYTRLYEQRTENGKPINCYLIYKRSSWMDSAEMAHLIDGAVQEARELGIDTDTPSERERYKDDQ